MRGKEKCGWFHLRKFASYTFYSTSDGGLVVVMEMESADINFQNFISVILNVLIDEHRLPARIISFIPSTLLDRQRNKRFRRQHVTQLFESKQLISFFQYAVR